MEDDMEDIYALKTFKRNMKKFLDNDVGMDITLRFEDKEDRYYYIVAYDKQRMEFMRSADADNYLVEPYNDLETLFSSTLIDGVCLNRDWDKLIEIGCEPDMEYMDDVIETYKKAALKRQSKFKQAREKGC